MPKARRTEPKTERKQLRAPDARQSDTVQVCFESPDAIWLSVKDACPDVMELQEFVTLVLERAVPAKDLGIACVDERHPVPKPPVFRLDKASTKVRCFKTRRVIWGRLIMWAAVSGNDLKELLNGILDSYIRKSRKSAKSGAAKARN